jgi:murein DD-endopeptidase MepM/ murein hydrolase activator NlpD
MIVRHVARWQVSARIAMCAIFVLVLGVVPVSPTLAAGVVPARAEINRAQPASAPGWLWPLEPPHRITRGFEAPPTRYAAGHRGIDIAASGSSPVVAPAAGVVRFSGVVVDRSVITLDLGNDVLVSMEPVAPSVPVGAHLNAGERLGAVATGGHCSNTCLHFGVRLHGEYVSPLLYLGGIQRAILLPLR